MVSFDMAPVFFVVVCIPIVGKTGILHVIAELPANLIEGYDDISRSRYNRAIDISS